MPEKGAARRKGSSLELAGRRKGCIAFRCHSLAVEAGNEELLAAANSS